MKLENYRLMKDPDRSFILHHETKSFSNWHYHPEFELVYIIKGMGRRLVGDNIDTFRPGDLVLLGPHLPHSWICDDQKNNGRDFRGEAIIIQFTYDFLGKEFMDIPENRRLKDKLSEASRGIIFQGKTKKNLISLLKGAFDLEGPDQLFVLMSFFRILSRTHEYSLLSSEGFMEPYHRSGNEPIQKAIDHILHNFHRKIPAAEVLDICNMSNTTFCLAFKRITRMTLNEYIRGVRIGYACKLLTSTSSAISQIALKSGFENISSFNQNFRKVKGVTPSAFRQTVSKHA